MRLETLHPANGSATCILIFPVTRARDVSPEEWAAVASPQRPVVAILARIGISFTVAPFQSVVSDQLWTVAVFTPKTQGAVTSVSLSYDITRVFTSTPGATQIRKGIAVQQD